jgi:uncharacterized protein YbbK (DUF523 family)
MPLSPASTTRPLVLVSACLVGLCTRYDGKIVDNPACREQLADVVWIPFCPEQLGGLPTPREAADIVGGDGEDVVAGRAKVLGKSGTDYSEAFIRGARQVLQIARSQQVSGVLLKARSPSCGISGTIGVTAALLRQTGLPLSEF